MNLRKTMGLLAALLVAVLLLGGCTESSKVSANISQQADNFNVTRRLAVINARTDKPVFELIGNFALKNNSTNELEVICEVSKGSYKKHFVYLNEWTIYIVEDVSGAYVDPYHYEINFLPQAFGGVTFTMDD